MIGAFISEGGQLRQPANASENRLDAFQIRLPQSGSSVVAGSSVQTKPAKAKHPLVDDWWSFLPKRTETRPVIGVLGLPATMRR